MIPTHATTEMMVTTLAMYGRHGETLAARITKAYAIARADILAATTLAGIVEALDETADEIRRSLDIVLPGFRESRPRPIIVNVLDTLIVPIVAAMNEILAMAEGNPDGATTTPEAVAVALAPTFAVPVL